MNEFRLGVVGFGNVVRGIHLEALSRLRGVAVVALAEADPSRREEARRRAPGAAIHSSYDDLLAMSDVEAVMVCLPTTLQADAAVAAFESGKHVYVEKPLATNLEDARAVLAAWRSAGTVGMVGLNYRLHPHYQRAREVIRSGRLGELVGARSIFSAAIALPQPAWKMSRRSGGGALLDFGSHHADLVHFLFGHPVREVFAEARSQRGENDSAVVELRLAGGLLVQSFFSLSAVDEERFEIYGQAGKLTVDRCYALDVDVREATRERFRLKRMWRGLRSLRHSRFLVTRSRAVGCEPSYSLALARFVEAARANRSLDPDLWDGYRSLAVIKAAEASIDSGAPVSLPEMLEPDLPNLESPLRPSPSQAGGPM
jgi:myo-inositol 2-dehydrogenase / D-chiro-inositol 1-dehydrogenase